MEIYNLAKLTNEYVGSEQAKIDPMATASVGLDQYLIPANATIVPPPEAQAGYARCFIDGLWVQVEDHRGQTVYSTSDASPSVMSELGAIPDGQTLLEPCEYPIWTGVAWQVDQVLLDAHNAQVAAQAAKAQSIIDNLPSWAVVGGKFDTMLADAKAATNLAQAKAVLIELINVQKKMARVLYWEVKGIEE